MRCAGAGSSILPALFTSIGPICRQYNSAVPLAVHVKFNYIGYFEHIIVTSDLAESLQ